MQTTWSLGFDCIKERWTAMNQSSNTDKYRLEDRFIKATLSIVKRTIKHQAESVRKLILIHERPHGERLTAAPYEYRLEWWQGMYQMGLFSQARIKEIRSLIRDVDYEESIDAISIDAATKERCKLNEALDGEYGIAVGMFRKFGFESGDR
ncbi:MAG: hypothetical protein RL173_1108 [Fibrobacterota bacterium]|jgi:hypothetical protein